MENINYNLTLNEDVMTLAENLNVVPSGSKIHVDGYAFAESEYEGKAYTIAYLSTEYGLLYTGKKACVDKILAAAKLNPNSPLDFMVMYRKTPFGVVPALLYKPSITYVDTDSIHNG